MMIDSFRQKLGQQRPSTLPLQQRPSNAPSISSSISNIPFTNNDSSIQQPEILGQTQPQLIANSGFMNLGQSKKSMGSQILNRASSSNLHNNIKKTQSQISLNFPLAATQTSMHSGISQFNVDNFLNSKYQQQMHQQQLHYNNSGNESSLNSARVSMNHNHHNNNYTHHHQSSQPSVDLTTAPTLKSFVSTFNDKSSMIGIGSISNKISLPHEGKAMLALYTKEDLKKYKNGKEESVQQNISELGVGEGSLDNLFKRRSSSVQNKYTHTSKKASINERTNKKFLATTLFGNMHLNGHYQDVASYKKDAVNLLANRIQKKFREFFQMIYEFAQFQEEIQMLTKYDSKFDIGEAFESFKNKQELKGTKNPIQLKMSKRGNPLQQSQNPGQLNLQKQTHSTGLKIRQNKVGKSIRKDNKENIYLSQDKMMSKTYNLDGPDTRKKIQKDATPLNIFQTYLQGQNMASPIEMDPLLSDQRYDQDDDLAEQILEFNKGFECNQTEKQKKLITDAKSSFKDKIKGLKSNFNELLSHRETGETKPFSDALGRVTNVMMTQRNHPDKENNINNLNKQNQLLQSQGLTSSRKTPFLTMDQINTTTKQPLKMNILKQKKQVKENQKLKVQDLEKENTFCSKDRQSDLDSQEEAQHLKDLEPKSNVCLEKLLEIIQIKEIKMKFFAMYQWKRFHLKDDSSLISDISMVQQPSVFQKNKVQQSTFNKQIVQEVEEQSIEDKLNIEKKRKFARMIQNAINQKREYMILGGFTQWKKSVKQDYYEEAKLDVLRQVIQQMQFGQRKKAFRKWKEETEYYNEKKALLKKDSCLLIKEQLISIAFRNLNRAFSQWKNSNKGKAISQKEMTLQRILLRKEFKQKNQSLKKMTQVNQPFSRKTFGSQREGSSGRNAAQNLRYL